MIDRGREGDSRVGATSSGAGAPEGVLSSVSDQAFQNVSTAFMPGAGQPMQVPTSFPNAHHRERSAYTAAGRPRREAEPNQSFEQLLMEQNKLLLAQVQLLQQQVQQPQSDRQSPQEVGQEVTLFQSPEKILNGVDPGLKDVFEGFAKEMKHLLSAWETQKALQSKYARLLESSSMHPHFQAEAEYKWQYDILSAWESMRQRHAKECFAFVCEHQDQVVRLYDQHVSVGELQNRLLDKLAAWVAEHGYNDDAVHNAMKVKAKQFVESTIRAERPKLQTRMNKDKENYEKRQQALIEAKSQWESMDVKDVLSPALLELAQAKTARNKPIRVQDGGALAFLVKDNAELCRQHNIKFEASQAPNTPKRRTRGRVSSRDRSSSTHKERPSSILRTPRSARSPRASSKVSAKSRGNSKSPGKQVHFKGKGKGNDKGKGKGRKGNSTKEAVFLA